MGFEDTSSALEESTLPEWGSRILVVRALEESTLPERGSRILVVL